MHLILPAAVTQKLIARWEGGGRPLPETLRTRAGGFAVTQHRENGRGRVGDEKGDRPIKRAAVPLWVRPSPFQTHPIRGGSDDATRGYRRLLLR